MKKNEIDSKYLHGMQGFAINNTDLFATETLVETYKIGADVGVKPRDMFRSVTIASVIVMLITLPVGLMLYYSYGIKPEGAAYMWSLGSSMAGSWNLPGWAWVGHPFEVGWKVAATFVVTFLVMGALVFLKAHFVWFPLNPVGAAMGVGMGGVVVGWGYSFLLTYVLKRLALRIGGVRILEDWITPVSVGFIVGYGIGVVLWNVASGIMFLYA